MKHKNLLLLIIFLVLVVLAFYCYIYNEKQNDINTTTIKLFFYNPSLDQGLGGVQCSEKGLVGVSRSIPKTTMPLTETIKLLLKGEITKEERDFGIESEFPLENFELEKAVVENGVATLTFKDPENKTVGGSCRIAILWNQIEKTAKQFSTVNEVRFLPDDLFQP